MAQFSFAARFWLLALSMLLLAVLVSPEKEHDHDFYKKLLKNSVHEKIEIKKHGFYRKLLQTSGVHEEPEEEPKNHGFYRKLLQTSAGHEEPEEVEEPKKEEQPLLQLEDDVWGPIIDGRTEREKRLFKPKGLGSIGVQVGKQVASKAINNVKQGVMKKVLSVSALSSSSSSGHGLQVAKKVGAKAAKAATVIGIKTLLLNLVFGKINQLIEWKTKLIDNLEKQNRAKNQQFLRPQTSTTPSDATQSFPVESEPESE